MDSRFKGLQGREGTTAVTALVTSDKIYVVSHAFASFLLFLITSQANAGDSRSVISVRGKVKPLSFDHKPTNYGVHHGT